MAGHADNKKQTAEVKDDVRTASDEERGVKFLGMKRLKVVRLKIGKDGRELYNFSPSVGGVPKEFLILPEIVWRDAADEDISGEMRRYVAALTRKERWLSCRLPTAVLSALI